MPPDEKDEPVLKARQTHDHGPEGIAAAAAQRDRLAKLQAAAEVERLRKLAEKSKKEE
jgi:hypothetical protein